MVKVPSDIEIVRNHKCIPIAEIAQRLGLKEYDLHGDYMAKVAMKVPSTGLDSSHRGKYVVVTGITPTPLGEGKSTTAIGLAQALGNQLSKKTVVCLRQPSQGPTFGIKGGAAGGGYSQVVPMENFNLHLTGDIHAITAAHNLVAAAIDARIFHESTQSDTKLFSRLVPKKPGQPRVFSKFQLARLKKVGISTDISPDNLNADQKKAFSRLNFDKSCINWNRVTDTNDRFLRKVTIGQAETEKGFTRSTQYDISVASELMAICSLCHNLKEAKERIRKVVVGMSADDPPKTITCEDLGIHGAVAVLLRDAIKPTLIQTLEGTPVFVHCGPFANIAHGNSSVIADKLALKLVGPDGYVLTEAGFGADIGLEKFINIKCRSSNIMPDCAVIVASVRALKSHGGGPSITPGAALPKEYRTENLELLEKGLCNLEAHIKNITKEFKIPVVVAVNKFSSDTEKEIALIREVAVKAGAMDACLADSWANGGKGAIDLGKAVMKACESPNSAEFLYDLNSSLKSKIETTATRIYSANKVDYSALAEEKIKLFQSLGYDKLPVCIAKTQYSFSADPTLKGAPKDFTLPIVDVRLAAGGGFVYPLAGDIQTMPGLPTRPAFFDIDVDSDTEEIQGLF